jgi:hypothetical protein
MDVHRSARLARSRAGLPLAAAACAAFACVNPNTYATPRTVPPNRLDFLVAPEVSGFGGELDGASEFARLVPTLPTIGVRYGLSERWDIGGRFSNLTGTSADIKWNPVRTAAFDLALAPGLQFYEVFGVGDSDVDNPSDESISVLIVHLPLMAGLNLSRSLSLVPTLGVSYAFAPDPPLGASDIELSQVVHGAFARAGLGIDLRLSDAVALHPEATALYGIGEMDGYLVYMVGLGFVFGALPEY